MDTGKPVATGEIALVPHAGYVYRAFDAADTLLYIGLTENVFQRLGGHLSSRSPWVREAVRIRWEQYRTYEQAALAETHAIRTELPKYNHTHNDRRKRADAMGFERLYAEADWRRLGEVVRAGRAPRRFTQTAMAGECGWPVDLWREMERGDRTEYPIGAILGLEDGMRWAHGSVESVLAGGEPLLLSSEQIRSRALSAANSVLSA